MRTCVYVEATERTKEVTPRFKNLEKTKKERGEPRNGGRRWKREVDERNNRRGDLRCALRLDSVGRNTEKRQGC